MPEKQSKTIPIFEAVEVVTASPEGVAPIRPVRARGVEDKVINMVETSIDVLRDNMSSFIESVGDMISSSVAAAGNYEIETFEVECQISGNGKIGFAGSSIGLTGGSGLKIIFKKKK